MKLTAMELIVIQTNDKGIFDSTYINDFEYIYNGVTYRVKIEQHLKREIRIGTSDKVAVTELFEMEAFIEQLLFIIDGRFYPIENIAMIDENEDSSIYQNKVDHHYNNRLPIYNSIDLCRYPFMKLVDYKDVDLVTIIWKWARISDELDIAFCMFLYCLSDIHMPIDCKISSLIEMAKPFGEIVEKNINTFNIERNKKTKKIELRTALEKIISTFGAAVCRKSSANAGLFVLYMV